MAFLVSQVNTLMKYYQGAAFAWQSLKLQRVICNNVIPK